MMDVEARKKLSEKIKKQYLEGRVPYFLNKKRPEDFRKKISKVMKGRIFSEEAIEKQRTSKIGSKNPMFGRTHTPLVIYKARIEKLSEKNPNWKGENVKNKKVYHEWLRSRYPVPKLCTNCNKEKKLYLASINGHNYTRNINDYKFLCASCHIKFDRGIIKLK